MTSFGTPNRPDRLPQEMQQRESMLWGKLAVKLAIGIPLTVLLPAVIAVVFLFWGWRPLGWFWSFVFWIALLSGALLYFARRHFPHLPGQSVFAEMMIQRIGPDAENPHAEEVARSPLDIALTGPREIFETIAIAQEAKSFQATSRIRAEEVLRRLAREDKGIRWNELQAAGEPIQDLLGILGYLKFSEWIEFSGDGRKVWMLSAARRSLGPLA